MKPDFTPDDFSATTRSAAQVRARLSGKRGREYWRSLEELSGSPEFGQFLENEFPQHFWAGENAVSRRDFLKLLGASLALAGVSGCAHQPKEEIVPYVNQPENMTLGKPLHFATATTLNGFATGVLVKSHEGRPTKIEGNPDHPASLGAADAITQAQILALYDPDRSPTLLRRGEPATWDSFLSAMQSVASTRGGAGLRILTETVTSPTLAAQFRRFAARFPEAKRHSYQPVSRDNARGGARLAFGEDAHAVHHFERAKIILSLDADFLLNAPGSVRYARDFMARRRVRAADARAGRAAMNRLYVVESTTTITGAAADHRLPLQPQNVELFARELAARLRVLADASQPSGVSDHWISALVSDLQSQRGASLVVVGESQPPAVHALAHAINETLGNVGKTVTYTAPIEDAPTDNDASLRELARDIQAGNVETLLILGGNPAFTAPADVPLGALLSKVKSSVHLASHVNETAALCEWHVPQTHDLEAWSDARAYDGTATIMQPLLAPLYDDAKSAHEVLAVLLGQPNVAGYEIVREYWRGKRPQNFEVFWRASLHDGIVAGSALPPKPLKVKADFATTLPQSAIQNPQSTIQIVFRPDPNIWDGRFANSGWLQELPKPLTTLTWDNTAQLNAATAAKLNLKNGDVVELRLNGRKVEAPIWIVPGQPDDTVTVHFGYGRTRAGQVGNGTGFNAYLLRDASTRWFGGGLEIRKTGQTYPLSETQNHHQMEGVDFVVNGTLAEFLKKPDFAHADPDEDPTKKRASLYPEFHYEGHKWGMSIDLNVCIGCNACTAACQAENNIPVVGKEEVGRGREMHWIRVDTYFEGDAENPALSFQPVPCMHCEKAPCEPVCPTGATQHSSEGLNEMIYNRCVGTRYCSNNCPYKVRRFNFLSYTDFSDKPTLKMAQNPDVTVRNRGVMEKCSYCVQRIEGAKVEAEKAGRALRRDEIVTACQQTCPTEAIVFGDLNDQNAQVAQLAQEPLNYGLLLELNTQPRTTYLARLKNPHPDLEEA